MDFNVPPPKNRTGSKNPPDVEAAILLLGGLGWGVVALLALGAAYVVFCGVKKMAGLM